MIGAASHTRSSRTIDSGPRQGQIVAVSTDAHATGVLVHASGALSTLVMSFDAVATQAANIEIHGETGFLIVPDPNHFDGDVKLRTAASTEWEILPVSAGYADSSRGVGLQDLAQTADGELPRANGELGFHVLDVMESVMASAHSGAAVAITSSCERPSGVPLNAVGSRQSEPVSR